MSIIQKVEEKCNLNNTNTCLGAGYVFTQQDKQLFTQAVVQFCAQDLHNSDVVAVSF